MTYELAFKKQALKEWSKLGSTIQTQFKKKLKERLETPHVFSAKIAGADNLYKIKLRELGYRLVYQVDDQAITVIVIAIGKRERNTVYLKTIDRLEE